MESNGRDAAISRKDTPVSASWRTKWRTNRSPFAWAGELVPIEHSAHLANVNCCARNGFIKRAVGLFGRRFEAV